MRLILQDNYRRLVEAWFRKGLIRPPLKLWQAQTRQLVAACVERGIAQYNGPAPVYREPDTAAEKQRAKQRHCMARLRSNRKTETSKH